MSFVTCDFSYSDRLAAELRALVDGAEGNVLFYLRFVLQAIPANVQERPAGGRSPTSPGRETCWRPSSGPTRTRSGPRRTVGHFRRFQNGPAFGRELADRFGFSILEEHEGTGLSPYRREDPELYRVIARKR